VSVWHTSAHAMGQIWCTCELIYLNLAISLDVLLPAVVRRPNDYPHTPVRQPSPHRVHSIAYTRSVS
jgi:hypothetical protein